MTVCSVSREDFPSLDNLFQTGFWGDFKTACGQQAVFFLCHHENKSFPLMVLLRHTKNDITYAYVPKGPTVSIPEEKRGIFLEKLSLELQQHLPSECCCIRYDLPWLSSFEFQVKEMPRKEVREIRMNYGTELGKLRKAPIDHFTADTVLVDLSLPPAQILSRMRQTTRNSIRRSYKVNNVFTITDSITTPAQQELFQQWYDIYYETSVRKNFYSEKLPYFSRLFSKQKGSPLEDCGKGLPLYAPTPDPSFFLLTTEHEGEVLSGMILGICGRTAYYMYAGSKSTKTEQMPNYGLQWEAMRFARMQGCRTYDLLGIPPNNNKDNPMSGLYIFKTGLGGTPVKFCGCWDFPYIDNEYNWLCNSEIIGGL